MSTLNVGHGSPLQEITDTAQTASCNGRVKCIVQSIVWTTSCLDVGALVRHQIHDVSSAIKCSSHKRGPMFKRYLFTICPIQNLTLYCPIIAFFNGFPDTDPYNLTILTAAMTQAMGTGILQSRRHCGSAWDGPISINRFEVVNPFLLSRGETGGTALHWHTCLPKALGISTSPLSVATQGKNGKYGENQVGTPL